MQNGRRLIEVDFPLEQVSLDSVHEKNVRHGHISTLHIWPARRPLAACRAALIAALLPDPGNEEERKAIYRRLAGTVKEKIEQKKVGGRTVDVRKRETEGGILHWGRENGPDLDWFREKIREAYGGRATARANTASASMINGGYALYGETVRHSMSRLPTTIEEQDR
jgi:Adenine-specific DNA methylase containing a Zn-ribbon